MCDGFSYYKSVQYITVNHLLRPDFLLVDLRDFFSDSGSGDEKKKEKKSFENDQLTGHF